jgi:hypothetical protein
MDFHQGVKLPCRSPKLKLMPLGVTRHESDCRRLGPEMLTPSSK